MIYRAVRNFFGQLLILLGIFKAAGNPKLWMMDFSLGFPAQKVLHNLDDGLFSCIHTPKSPS